VFRKDVAFFGRREDNDIVLAHTFVSSRHGRVLRRGLALLVEDMGSTNGTTLNGQPLTPMVPQPLKPSDSIEIETVVIRARLVEGVEEAAPATYHEDVSAPATFHEDVRKAGSRPTDLGSTVRISAATSAAAVAAAFPAAPPAASAATPVPASSASATPAPTTSGSPATSTPVASAPAPSAPVVPTPAPSAAAPLPPSSPAFPAPAPAASAPSTELAPAVYGGPPRAEAPATMWEIQTGAALSEAARAQSAEGSSPTRLGQASLGDVIASGRVLQRLRAAEEGDTFLLWELVFKGLGLIAIVAGLVLMVMIFVA
jgi:hypothetical protein